MLYDLLWSRQYWQASRVVMPASADWYVVKDSLGQRAL